MCWLPTHAFTVEDCDLGSGDLADYFDLDLEGDGYDFVLTCVSAYGEASHSAEVFAAAFRWIAEDLAKPKLQSRIRLAFLDAEIKAASPEAIAASRSDEARERRAHS